MNIFIPTDKKQEFLELSKEYSVLYKELEEEPDESRHAEIIDRIVFISEQFETGFGTVVGFEEE